MNGNDAWWLVALHCCTLLSAAAATVTACYAAWRGWRNGRAIHSVHLELNSRLDAALAAAERLGFIRGTAEEQSRHAGPSRPAT